MEFKAIKDAKRMVYLSKEIYIPKRLRKLIKIVLDKKGNVVIKGIRKKK